MSTVVLMHADLNLAHHLRDVIAAQPGFEVTGVANNFATLREVCNPGMPDLLIVDLMLPPTYIKSLLQGLRGQGSLGPPLILALAVSADDARLMDALRHGADGYYAHARPTTTLMTAIEQLLNGESTMSPQIARHVKAHFDNLVWTGSDIASESQSFLHLTQKDRLLLQRMAQGYLVDEVARGLQLTPSAVRVRIRHIYHRLQFDLRAGALSLAA